MCGVDVDRVPLRTQVTTAVQIMMIVVISGWYSLQIENDARVCLPALDRQGG